MDPRAAYEESERTLLSKAGIAARTHWLDLGAPRTRVRMLEVGKGDPVVLVHGGGGMAMNWLPLLTRLDGFRLLALDRPGCGLSEFFDYTNVDLRRHGVQVLESVLDAMGLKAAQFIGNSMGGLWALSLAIAAPERVRSLVLPGCPALLLDTGAPAPMHVMAVFGKWLIRLSGPPTTDGVRRILTMVMGAHAVAQMDPGQIELGRLAQSIPGTGLSTMTLFGRALTLFGRRAEAVFGESDLKRVTQPTLFIWGESDVFGKPDAGRRACTLAPRARLEVLEGGHVPWMDDADTCGRLAAEFLRACTTTESLPPSA